MGCQVDLLFCLKLEEDPPGQMNVTVAPGLRWPAYLAEIVHYKAIAGQSLGEPVQQCVECSVVSRKRASFYLTSCI